jgi:hypothetical protein
MQPEKPKAELQWVADELRALRQEMANDRRECREILEAAQRFYDLACGLRAERDPSELVH